MRAPRKTHSCPQRDRTGTTRCRPVRSGKSCHGARMPAGLRSQYLTAALLGCRAPPLQARFARSGLAHDMTLTGRRATFATCPRTASGSPRAPCDRRRPSCSPAPRPSCPSCRGTSWKCAGASPGTGWARGEVYEMQVAARGAL